MIKQECCKTGQDRKNRIQKGYHAPFSNALSKESNGNSSHSHSHSAVGQKYFGRVKLSLPTLMITQVLSLEQISDEQLEDILTKQRLEREQKLLKDAAHVDVVQAKDCLYFQREYWSNTNRRSRGRCNGRHWFIVNCYLPLNVALNWKTFESARKIFSKT